MGQNDEDEPMPNADPDVAPELASPSGKQENEKRASLEPKEDAGEVRVCSLAVTLAHLTFVFRKVGPKCPLLLMNHQNDDKRKRKKRFAVSNDFLYIFLTFCIIGYRK